MSAFSIFDTVLADATGIRTAGIAVTGTNTYYSDVWSGKFADVWDIMLQWTGTPTGTFTLWATDKGDPGLADDSDWVQETSFTPTNPAGAAGKMRDNAANATGRKWRLKYVNSAGSGTLFGWANTPRFYKA